MKSTRWKWFAAVALIVLPMFSVAMLLKERTDASQESLAALVDSQVLLERDLANLESQLKAEIARLAVSLDAYARNEDVTRSIKTVREDLNRLSQDVQALLSDERISTLANQLSQYEAVATSLSSSIDNMRSRMADFVLYVQSIEEHQVRIGHLSEEIATLRSQLAAADATTRTHGSAIDELRVSLTETSKALADRLSQLHEYLVTLTERLDVVAAALNEMQTIHGINENKLDDHATTFTTLQGDLARLSERFAKVEQWQAGIEQELTKANNTIHMLAEQFSEQIAMLQSETQTMFNHGIITAIDPIQKAIDTLEHLYDELIAVDRQVQDMVAYAIESIIRQEDRLTEHDRALLVIQQDIAENNVLFLHELDSRTAAIERGVKEQALQMEQKLMELEHSIKKLLSEEITASLQMKDEQLAAIPYVQEQLLIVVRTMQEQLTRLQEENLLLSAAVEDLNRSNQILQQEIARLRLGQ